MSTEEKPGRMPLAPAVRARLQKCFEHGTKSGSTGNYDYANEMYALCVLGDPPNPLYVKALLANLSKKYNNNKKGKAMANLTMAPGKAGLKTAVARKKWEDALRSGLKLLETNPWDAAVLADLARACEAQEFDESEVEYLKQALDADKEDPETNRLLGRAYDRIGQFNDALECFNRVLKANPKDEEAIRAMSHLAVKKTIKAGGYEEAQNAQDVRAGSRKTGDDDETSALSPEEKLLRVLQKDPTDKNSYIELNDLYLKDELFDKSVALMKQALDATGGGDIMLRERYEDAQLRLARQHVMTAEAKARAEQTPESVALFNNLKVELNNKEMEIYGKRCERYPTNLGFKYELALRLQRAKKFHEAIKLFQEARSDLKRKGAVLLALGDCFYSIKQYRLALQNYDAAVGEISERDPDVYKGVIYKAARVAEYLKEWDTAEKHYNKLASVDFGYQDVAERLDKIMRIRENGGDPDLE